MTSRHRTILFLLILSSGISVVWGFALKHAAHGVIGDYKIVYFGARCMVQGCDPYNEAQLMRVYEAEGGERPSVIIEGRTQQVVASQMYLPTAAIYIAPFGFLSWGIASLLWTGLTVGGITAAAFLMWDLGEVKAPELSLYLVCIMLWNSGVLFAGGNPSGIAIALCLGSVWCIVTDRFVPVGLLCMAISLGIKPHDAGFVWLYFLLAGGTYRKRALQALALTCILAIPALIWVSHLSPNWMQELHSIVSAYSTHGSFNDPGPVTDRGAMPGMIIDLQTIVSLFRDEPGFYNPVSYLLCAPFLLAWMFITLRSRSFPANTWLALASIAALSMLPLYHRQYDAKLLLLTIPACAILWREGGPIGWAALLLTSTGILVTSDIPLAILELLTRGMHFSTMGLSEKLKMVVLGRPVPLVLLCLGVFYLWVYMRRSSDVSAVSAAPEVL